MKTILPATKTIAYAFATMILTISVNMINAQAIGGSPNGLVFKNPTLSSGKDLEKGSVYLFKSVTKGTNATVTISDLVNGASVKKIDDNSGGLGYTDAFQPEVQIGKFGESYALFTIKFIDSITGLPTTLQSVQATSLDIDGNATLKEFADINLNGGSATYMGNTLELLLKSLPIINTLFSEFRADNILGIEHDGIDTSGKGVMYTASNTNISSFSIKYGAKSLSNNNSSRQFSLYMKGFQYPSQILLPLNLLSFTAFLNSNNVDLKWTTSAEKNVSHFTVEKSMDGKNFSDAATVFAYGNTTKEENYNYTDNIVKISSAIIYYRLRCVDEDGKYIYSQVRMIRVSQDEASIKVMAYPNPFTNELRVTVPQSLQGKEFKIEIFNTGGQVVKTKSIAMASQTETITTNDLQRGFYVIRITNADEKVQYKVIKN